MGKFMKYFIITLAIIYTCTLPLAGMHKLQDDTKKSNNNAIIYKGVLQCACLQVFNDHKEILQHVKKNHRNKNNGFSCPSCDYEPVEINRLIKHFPTHTNEIIASCNQCNLHFNSNNSQVNHKDLHQEFPTQFTYLLRTQPLKINNEGKFNCPTCDYTTQHLRRLLDHITCHLLIESYNTSEPEFAQDTPTVVQNEPNCASTATEQTFQWTAYIDKREKPNKKSSTTELPPLLEYLRKIPDAEDLTLPPLRNYFPEDENNNDEDVLARYKLPTLKRQFQEDELGEDAQSSSLFPTQALVSKAQSPILGKRKHAEEKKK